MEPITKAALLGTLISNDCWIIHLYAKGDKFDDLHNLAEKYYLTVSSQTDYLMELAIEMDKLIVNPSEALKYIPNYIIENSVEYTWEPSLEIFQHKLGTFIGALKEVRASIDRADVQSWIDDNVRDLEKEVHYRLVRRSEVRPSMLNGFVSTGLDNHIAYTTSR